MSGKESDVKCAKCGNPITDESPNGERKPCSQCGSLARSFEDSVGFVVSAAVGAYVEGVTYPQSLLSAAKGLIDNAQFSISVVVSHMACEIATERTLSESFAKKGIQYLEEPVGEFLNGYNITNYRIRSLYTALTRDEIQNQPFWEKLMKSSTRRNKIIHEGLIVGKTEADESYQAVGNLIAHLKK